MDERQATFVETMGQFLAAQGLTPMAGRMWGWLLICEPAEQTAAGLAESLQASRGSISSAARVLVSTGLIRRTTRRGDRKEYFSVPAGFTRAFVAAQVPRLRAFRELTETGLQLLADRPSAARERIQEVHDLYAYFEQVYPLMLDQYERHQRDEGPNA